ncbi:phenylacetate--CoA ligase family protein [Syntrophomonas erecta subsp. sporosyntropha]
MSLSKKVFLKSPYFLKKVFVNVEAIRRDYFRRWGDYSKLYEQLDNSCLFPNNYKETQDILFRKLATYVKENVKAYENIDDVFSINNINAFPVLKKGDYIHNQNMYISKEAEKRKLYKGRTSGSTGKPMSYFIDRESVRWNFIYADKMLEFVGLNKNDVKCRFSGVTILDFNHSTPPFWIYINKYKQLQMSSYHLNELNFKLYLDAMIKKKVTFGTGYANTWLILAEFVIKHNYSIPNFKAIVLDSEGITSEQQDIVEKAFKCKVYQTYGLGEVGQIAFQCEKRCYHILPQTAYVEILDDKLNKVHNGEIGEIVVTNLYSPKTPFIRYATGDLGKLKDTECECGRKGQVLSEIIGRIDDYVITKDGKKINRLSHIIKPAIGVVKSQLIQDSVDSLLIHIIPDKNFKEESMKKVIENAKYYLGDMKIDWKIVNELEKTSNGKIKHVLRKIKN